MDRYITEAESFLASNMNSAASASALISIAVSLQSIAAALIKADA